MFIMLEPGEINLLTFFEKTEFLGGIGNRYMLMPILVCRMFRVDMASEAKMVLGAFFLVIGSVAGGLLGRFLDCQFVARITCLDADSGSSVVGYR
jgi:hypothetical protein